MLNETKMTDDVPITNTQTHETTNCKQPKTEPTQQPDPQYRCDKNIKIYNEKKISAALPCSVRHRYLQLICDLILCQ